MADGLGTAVGSIFNAMPNTSYSQNAGLVAFTGVISRHVGTVAGVILVLLGLFPKLGGIIAAMPESVIGGAAIIMFGLINIGWLIFREQNPVYLWKFITSSPLGISSEEWQTGLYFFAYSLILATPLAIHCWTDKWCTGDDHWESRQQNWKWVIAQSALAGILLTAIFLLKSENSSEFIYFQF